MVLLNILPVKLPNRSVRLSCYVMVWSAWHSNFLAQLIMSHHHLVAIS